MKFLTRRFYVRSLRKRIAFSALAAACGAACSNSELCIAQEPAVSASGAASSQGEQQSPHTEQTPHLALQQSHSGRITAVAISPDGKWVATGGQDHTVKVWNLASGELIYTLPQHRSDIGLVSFSSDSKSLVTGEGHWRNYGGTGTVRFWNLQTGQLQRTLRAPGHVEAVAISADWKIIARAGEQWTFDKSPYNGTNIITLWDARSGRLLRTIKPKTKGFSRQRTENLVFSPDNKLLAGAGWDNAVSIWDVASGKLKRSLPQHGGYQPLAFSPNSKTVASAMRTNGKARYEVRLWDVSTGALRRILSGSGSQNGSLAFSRDGTALVSGDFDRIAIWNLRNGKQERALPLRSEAGSLSAISPDGSQIVGIGRIGRAAAPIGDSDSESVALNVWKRASGQLLWTVPNRSLYQTPLHVALHRDGRTLIVRQGDGTTTLWDSATIKLQRTFDSSPASSPITLSPDGKTLVRWKSVDEWTSAWQLWDTATGTRGHTLPVPGGGYEMPTGGTFSHDSQKFVVTSRSDVVGSGGVTVWNLPTGKALPGFEKERSQVLSVAFSRDDKLLALGHWDTTVSVWDATSGAAIVRLSDPDSHKADQRVKPTKPSKPTRKNLAEKEPSKELTKPQDGPISAVAFAPDGKTLASGDDSGRIRLWNLQDQSALFTWAGHTDGIQTLAFSSDGQRLASGGKDHVLKIWDVASGELQATWEGHHDAVTSAFFLSDGNTLVSASDDGTLRFWNDRSALPLITLLPLSARSVSTRSASLAVRKTNAVQWIAVTPGGYYTGSKDVERFIRWRVGTTLWPAEKFESLYHRLDLLQQTMFESQTHRPDMVPGEAPAP